MADFTLSMKNFEKLTKKQIEAVVVETAFNIYSEIIDISPVDTGRFRSNNILSVDAPSFEKIEIESASSSKLKAKETLSTHKIGKDIYIQNNLDYSETIEFGWYPKPVKFGTRIKIGISKNEKILYEVRSIDGYSLQAPKGVYGVSILRFSKFFNNNVKEMK